MLNSSFIGTLTVLIYGVTNMLAKSTQRPCHILAGLDFGLERYVLLAMAVAAAVVWWIGVTNFLSAIWMVSKK